MGILLKFEEKVKKIEDFCQNLECFDNTSKSLDDWMNRAAKVKISDRIIHYLMFLLSGIG